MSENDKKEKINIKIDTERTELLARENERLRMEKEKRDDLEDMDVQTSDNKSIAEGVKEALRQKYQDKGHTAPTLETESDLKNAIEILKDLPDKKAPAGSAPMNAQQMGVSTDLYTHRFEDFNELISTLRERARNGSKEAQSYLDTLTERAYKIMRTTQSPISIPSRNDPENMPLLKQQGPYKVLVDPHDSDIWKLQQRWREERKKLMERGEEQ